MFDDDELDSMLCVSYECKYLRKAVYTYRTYNNVCQQEWQRQSRQYEIYQRMDISYYKDSKSFKIVHSQLTTKYLAIMAFCFLNLVLSICNLLH